MNQEISSLLERIVADKREELAARRRLVPPEELSIRLEDAPPARPLAEALRCGGISLIAEVKKASPSRGLLKADLDPVEIARLYARSGAVAISVLTEERYFLGGLDQLSAVRTALPDVGHPPLLRKDFLFDSYQLVEARVHGADSVLLIAAVLDDDGLKAMIGQARDLGMTALVEVHNEGELKRALWAGAEVVGINNRDLRTFHVDLSTTERLRPMLPPETVVVAESGIRNRDDIERLRDLRVDAVLIGESLVTAPDPAAKIRELLS